MKYYLFLIVAIFFEVIATSAVKASDGFTKFWPSVLVVIGYGIALYLFSICVRYLNFGIANALWAGIGIILVVFSGLFFFKQHLDLAAIIGIIFIIIGVIIINVFSKTTGVE